MSRRNFTLIFGRLLLAALAVASSQAFAAKFLFDFAGDSVETVTNTTVIAGVAVRTEGQNERMIAKGHLDPHVCGRTADGKLWYMSCQGLFREQSFPAAHLANAPGLASSNFDQGNLRIRGGAPYHRVLDACSRRGGNGDGRRSLRSLKKPHD